MAYSTQLASKCYITELAYCLETARLELAVKDLKNSDGWTAAEVWAGRLAATHASSFQDKRIRGCSVQPGSVYATCWIVSAVDAAARAASGTHGPASVRV